AFDFLTKPIDLEDLEITIEKATEIVQRERTAALVRETFGRYLSDSVVGQQDLYAKVTNNEQVEGQYLIRFTAAPGEIVSALDELCGSA
ncbi:MAG: hypothetical protein ACC655_03475, partial [Rhodothermia bacterium]